MIIAYCTLKILISIINTTTMNLFAGICCCVCNCYSLLHHLHCIMCRVWIPCST